jgi:hypothetical protein
LDDFGEVKEYVARFMEIEEVKRWYASQRE